MSDQLDRIEEKLTALCRHLGLEGASKSAPSPESPEEEKKRQEAIVEAADRFFRPYIGKNGELNEAGKRAIEEAWLHDGIG